MKRPTKTIIALISIPIFILLFFSPNIYGYFRFKHYCSTEGGLRVYEKLERNAGWWAKDKYDAQTAALLSGVGFVRYQNKEDGNAYDLKYIGGNPSLDRSFAITVADFSKVIKYSWRTVNQAINNETRLRRYGNEVLDFKTNKLAVSYYFIGYEKFDRTHTPLDMPSEIYCYNDIPDFYNVNSGWVESMNNSFKIN